MCLWGLKELVDGGKREAGVPDGTVDEGREVGRFGSQERITLETERNERNCLWARLSSLRPLCFIVPSSGYTRGQGG